MLCSKIVMSLAEQVARETALIILERPERGKIFEKT